MKKVISTAKKKMSVIIITGLVLANIVAFSLAAHYLGNASANSNVEVTSDQGLLLKEWKIFGWGYSILEYVK